MTVANINVRQVLLKRGNTAVSSTYTGPIGEITVDTTLHAVRVHDGVTPGGFLLSNSTLLQSNIDYLISNVANLKTVAYTGSYNDLTNNTNPGSTPPSNPAVGTLWYDTAGGRTYIWYDSTWVDASPEAVYKLPVASATQLGGIRVGNNLTIDSTGNLSAVVNTLGNLSVADQTISGSDINTDITLAPNGSGLIAVPGLKIPVGSVIQGTSPISVVIANLTIQQVLDYSTSSTDNLVLGEYGLPNGISGAGTGWTVYQMTTVPSPVLQVGDHISGIGIPNLSNVLFIGSGVYSNVVISDHTILGVPTPPGPGTTVFTTRDVVNPGLAVTTSTGADIKLAPGAGGSIVPGADVLPFVNAAYNLGSPSRRFREVWLGAGTIYVLDETLGTDQAIGARDGNLYVGGGSGLTVGEFTLYGNTIAIKNPAEDIYIGTSYATGNINFNRPLQVYASGTNTAPTFQVSRTGLATINPSTQFTQQQSALSIVGSSTGTQQPRTFTGTMLQITGLDNTSARLSIDAFGGATNAYASIAGRAARGSVTSPSAIQAGDTLIRMSGVGWGTTGYVSTIARVSFEAAQNFSDTAAGTRIAVYTTPLN